MTSYLQPPLVPNLYKEIDISFAIRCLSLSLHVVNLTTNTPSDTDVMNSKQLDFPYLWRSMYALSA